MTPYFSIIMANHNGSKYISFAIDSVIEQSYLDWEVIIVDDASTDDSVVYLNKNYGDNNKIKIINNESQLGPAATRNRAIESALGKWIVIVDSDDILHNHRLRNFKQLTEGSKAHIIADNIIQFYENGTYKPKLLLDFKQPRYINLEEYLKPGGARYGYLKPCINSSFLKEKGISYREELTNSEDYYLIVDLLLEGARYYITNYPGYLYRKHESSISHKRNYEQLDNLLNTVTSISKNINDESLQCLLNVQYNSVLCERDYAFEIHNIQCGNNKLIHAFKLLHPRFRFHIAKYIKSRIAALIRNNFRIFSYSACIITTDKKLLNRGCIKSFRSSLKIYYINDEHNTEGYNNNLLEAMFIVQSTERCIIVSKKLYEDYLKLVISKNVSLYLLCESMNYVYRDISNPDVNYDVCVILKKCLA